MAVPAPSPAWITIRVGVPPALADAVANFLVEAGASGVLTEADGARTRLEAPVPAATEAQVVAAVERYLASLGEIAPAARGATVEAVPVPEADWEEIWREHHWPVAVGRRLLVAPPWNVPRPAGREVLVIEPGMAFGTGQHATTRACLEAIEGAVETGAVRSALDVGTGSGVLALALARLGVERVVALDTDPAVVPLAHANLLRNGAARVALLAGPLAAVRGRFDLVVANLLADALVTEAGPLAHAVGPAGRLVVSGLLAEQLPAVRRAYPGWRVAETRAAAAWRTLTLVREP
ncbi:MAG TPA: 50S ribosomal protein L11 methyltransferase [Candidatus Limnocylindria bacterium]|nr:50S ribosomal protein L11 methyltransferase [Candidatus Limnocylindria bacterium]